MGLAQLGEYLAVNRTKLEHMRGAYVLILFYCVLLPVARGAAR
jgi:hypothetical protein